MVVGSGQESKVKVNMPLLKILLLILTFPFFCLYAQEKQQPDLMHNPRLYFNRLPENAKTLVSEFIYHNMFQPKKFHRYNPNDFEEILRQVSLFPSITSFSFLNTTNKVNDLYQLLFLANYNPHISCLQIRFKLQEQLPAAARATISDGLIVFLKIRYYTEQELAAGLRKNHHKMAQEYLDRSESERINKFHLTPTELATGKLIRLMKPPFDTEHRSPLGIEIPKSKDVLIAPQVAELLEQGAYPNAYCYDTYPLLICAAAWRMPQVVELLLRAGADANERAWALRVAKGGKVTKVLLSHGADPNKQSKVGQVALMPMHGYSSVTKVRLLLQVGADPNIAQTHEHIGFTPLIYYMFRLTKYSHHIPIITALLDAGADRTMQIEAFGGQFGDKKIITAEDIARKCKWKEVINLLSETKKIA